MKLSCEKYLVKQDSAVSWSYNGHPLICYFRSLICQLEDVDPGKLKHEEKLAFWINIHNALVMHVIFIFKTMFHSNSSPFVTY